MAIQFCRQAKQTPTGVFNGIAKNHLGNLKSITKHHYNACGVGIVKQLQNVKNCVIASRDEITAWQSNELHSNSSTLISVVTDLLLIISGSLNCLRTLSLQRLRRW
ncbi:MAG: hypothetical protein IJV35_05535 [Neisseriaceae bacterium]|nr:hypothetical protein [Neisseriaceae bacterium]